MNHKNNFLLTWKVSLEDYDIKIKWDKRKKILTQVSKNKTQNLSWEVIKDLQLKVAIHT